MLARVPALGKRLAGGEFAGAVTTAWDQAGAPPPAAWRWLGGE